MALACPDGTELHYADRAVERTMPVSTPVVFCHGLLSTRGAWDGVVRALPPRLRTVTVDLPGHGSSSRGSDGLTIHDLSSLLVALLDKLGIDAAVIVGSSAGATVALHLAVVAPARVAGLVLLGAQSRAETAQSRERHHATLRMVQRLGAAPVLRGLASVMFGESTRRARPELIAAWIAQNAALDPMRAMPVVRAVLERPDTTPLLPQVRCPALVLHGAEDALVSAAASAHLAAMLPRGRVETVAGAGHLAPIEQAEEVARHVAAFVDRVEAGLP